MKSAVLTLDENRKKIKSGGFAQTHHIDENHKKLDESFDLRLVPPLRFSCTPYKVSLYKCIIESSATSHQT